MAQLVKGLSVVAVHDAGTDFTNAHDTDPNEISATTNNALITAARSSQGTEATSADSTAAVTAANILTRVVKCTPSGGAREKDTDTAANLISGLDLSEQFASFDFCFINLDGSNAVTLDEGTGVTLLGNMVIATTSSGLFRIVRTSAVGATDAVTVIRIA